MKSIKIIFLLLLVLGCKPKHDKPETKSWGTILGKVDSRLSEASGLVASVNNPGFLWTHNDSGNPAEIFLIDQQAKIKLVVSLANVHNRDWEDIAIDIDSNGKSYLYIADIGDNFLRYDEKFIYRFEEPVLDPEKEKYITNFDTLIFKLPDGKCDAETILIDPTTHNIFIISKRRGSSGVYSLPNQFGQRTMTAKKITSIGLWEIVGGDISPDGQQVLLKSYDSVYYWKKLKDENLQQLFSNSPLQLPYQREPQGEAIAWSRSGKEFYTLSESVHGKRASLTVQKMKDQED